MHQEELKNLKWHSVGAEQLQGLGWKSENRVSSFHRLPATLEAEIPPELWHLGCQPAGLHVDFWTRATAIHVRYSVGFRTQGRYHMAPMGIAGMDLYGRSGTGTWHWAGSLHGQEEAKGCEQLNREPLDGTLREYRIYLPLRSPIDSLEIGTGEDLEFVIPMPRKPIAYYGTSIVHGEGVSRPGLTHAAQCARALGREILNLGFCGRARCEIAMATALGRLDPCLYIVDVLPNNSADQLNERLPRFLGLLREARPKTPILILGDRVYPDAAFLPDRGRVFLLKNQTLEMIVQQLKDEGLKHLHLHLHPDWYGPEGSSDGSHPNDLGATHMAEALTPIVRSLIG